MNLTWQPVCYRNTWKNSSLSFSQKQRTDFHGPDRLGYKYQLPNIWVLKLCFCYTHTVGYRRLYLVSLFSPSESKRDHIIWFKLFKHLKKKKKQQQHPQVFCVKLGTEYYDYLLKWGSVNHIGRHQGTLNMIMDASCQKISHLLRHNPGSPSQPTKRFLTFLRL